MHQVAGLLGEIRRVMGLVQNGLPHHHGGMVPVPAHHLADVVINPVRKRPLAPELPARRSDDDEKAHEGRILRIMGAPDYTHAGLPQLHGVLPLQVVGNCIPQPGEILVPVAANQLFREQGAIQHQPLFRNLHGPDAHPHGAVVQQMGRILGIVPSGGVPYLHAQGVQVGIVRRPRLHIGDHQGNIHFTRGMGRNDQRGGLSDGVHALGVRHQRLHAHLLFLVRIVGHLHLHSHPALAGTGVKGFRPEENSAAGNGSGLVRVRDIDRTGGNQVNVTVNASEVGEIQAFLGLARRIGPVVGIVRLHDDHVLLARLQPLVQIHDDGKITPEMLRGLLPVHPNLALPHDAFKIQGIPPAFQLLRGRERLPVPHRPLVIGAAAGLLRKKLNAVGKIHGFPGRIIKVRTVHSFRGIFALEQLPAHVHAVDIPLGRIFRQAEGSCYGIGSRG